jgi:AcrR family transcriptional regulator
MGASVPKDGRAARSYRARIALAEALLDLVNEGIEQPTAVQIAERAKVSLRLVFHHFEDLEAIYASAADLQIQRVSAMVKGIDPALPFDERVDAFIRTRARVLEYVGRARRASLRLESSSAEIARRLKLGQEMTRAHTLLTFDAELKPLTGDDAMEVRAALDGVTSWEMWEFLRRRAELSIKQSSKVVERMIRAMLKREK